MWTWVRVNELRQDTNPAEQLQSILGAHLVALQFRKFSVYSEVCR